MSKEIHYRITWRTRGHHPGFHRSNQGGAGLEFRGLAPLLVARDPRRLDLRSSLRDPFEQFLVRTFRQRSQVPVFLLADLSASMGFVGEHRKMDVVADLAEALAYSAHRTGDRFGFLGFDDALLTDLQMSPTHFLAAGLDLGQRLRNHEAGGHSSRGLLEAVSYLPRQRSLVFLASDFHLPLAELEQALLPLGRHACVPLVLWDRTEYERLPRFGFATVQDAETGEQRTLLMRATLRQRIQAAFLSRRQALVELFADHQSPALFLEDGFDAAAITQYFYDRELAQPQGVAA